MKWLTKSKKILKNTLKILFQKPQPKFYLLALFDEEAQINRVQLFNTPKDAKEFIKDQGLSHCTAYLIDLKHVNNRPFIKLN